MEACCPCCPCGQAWLFYSVCQSHSNGASSLCPVFGWSAVPKPLAGMTTLPAQTRGKLGGSPLNTVLVLIYSSRQWPLCRVSRSVFFYLSPGRLGLIWPVPVLTSWQEYRKKTMVQPCCSQNKDLIILTRKCIFSYIYFVDNDVYSPSHVAQFS